MWRKSSILRAGFSALATLAASSVGEDAGIEQLRLTPHGSTGVRVTFVVLGKRPNGTASVELSSGQRFEAIARTYLDEGQWAGTIYSADVNNVKESCFSYTAHAGTLASKSVRACLVPSSYPLRIAAVADIGAPSVRGSPGVSNWTIAYLNSAAQSDAADLGLIAGDIAYIDRSTCNAEDRDDLEVNYDEFFRAMEPFFARVPSLAAVGNHEAPGAPAFAGYLSRLGADMPGAGPGSEGLWHLSVVGRVAFLTLSSEHNCSVGSPQQEWVVKVLADLANKKQRGVIDWIVAQMHRAFYTSTNDYYDREISGPHLRAAFETLMRTGTPDGMDWNGQDVVVDLLLGGHLHNAEQFLPAFNGSATAEDYHNPTATVQLVLGNAGDQEGLTDSWRDSWEFSTLRIAELGYANITAHNSSVLEVQSVFVPNATSASSYSRSFFITRDASRMVLA